MDTVEATVKQVNQSFSFKKALSWPDVHLLDENRAEVITKYSQLSHLFLNLEL